MNVFRCRRLAGAFLGVLALACVPPAGGQGDDLLKLEATVEPRRLSRGEAGKVILKLTVPEGVIISPEPAFLITFEPLPDIVFPKTFFTASDLGLEVIEDGSGIRLNVARPVAVPSSVGLEARRGGHILAGRIKFVARSRTAGWCLKSSAKFSAPFVTRSTIRKKT
jgi:hypothetical protein